jgi:quaternary ammonium compound-resistance protein SugE
MTNLNWLYLFIAALLETAWTYSIKLLTFKDVLTLRFHNFYKPTEGLPILLPFLGYIFFGIGNIYFFSMAMKYIPTAIAFAVWTSLTLVLIKLTDVFWFHQKVTLIEIFYTLLILIGIVGLKVGVSK